MTAAGELDPRALEAHREFLATRHLGSLDGLRAFAIAAVVAHHAGVGGPFGRGILGVSLFFSISGFLVTTVLLRERARTGTVSLRNFRVRRILRIFPAYFAVLALYVALVAVLERGTPAAAAFFSNLPYYATFTANLFVDRGPPEGRVIFYFAWSLSTQEQFCLVWPWLLRRARGWRGPALAAAALLLGDQAVRLAAAADLVGPDGPAARLVTGVWAPLCLGALAALLLHHAEGFALARRVAGRPWSVPLALALLVVALAEGMPTLAAYCAIAYLLVACAIGRTRWVERVLDHRVTVYVGTVSYGMYLLHLLAINAVRRAVAVPPVLTFVAALPLSIALASVSYHLLEKRFLRLKDRLLERRTVNEGAPASTGATPPG